MYVDTLTLKIIFKKGTRTFMKKQLAIFIDSFDDYKDVWPAFFNIFNRYWLDCKYKKYLSCNKCDFHYKDLKILKTGKEIDWYTRTIKSLEMIEEDYVLFLLEDYFFSKTIKNEEIDQIVEYMTENNVFYYQLSSVDLKGNSYIVNIDNIDKIDYPISLQIAIWNKKFFLNELHNMYKIGAKTPWDFEKYYIQLKQENPNYLINIMKNVRYDNRDLFGYKNGILQGQWIPKTVKFYEKKGINIDTSKRKKMSLRRSFMYDIKVFLSKHMSKEIKQKSKKYLKYLGIKFMID